MADSDGSTDDRLDEFLEERRAYEAELAESDQGDEDDDELPEDDEDDDDDELPEDDQTYLERFVRFLDLTWWRDVNQNELGRTIEMKNLWETLSFNRRTKLDLEVTNRDFLLREPYLQPRDEGEVVAVIHLARWGYSGEIVCVNTNILKVIENNVEIEDRKYTYRVLFVGEPPSPPPSPPKPPIRSFKLTTEAYEHPLFMPSVGIKIESGKKGFHPSVDRAPIGVAVRAAIEAGFRHFDCDLNNEKKIGKAIKDLIDDGIVERKHLWLTCRVLLSSDLTEADIQKSFKNSLMALESKYINLFLMEWPTEEVMVEVDVGKAWELMEHHILNNPKCLAIGVCNFPLKKLVELMDNAAVPPSVHQLNSSPFCPRAVMQRFCRANEIHITVSFPLDDMRKLRSHPVMLRAAERLGQTPARVAVQWGLQEHHSVVLPVTSLKDFDEFPVTSLKDFDKFRDAERFSIPKKWMIEISKLQLEKPVTPKVIELHAVNMEPPMISLKKSFLVDLKLINLTDRALGPFQVSLSDGDSPNEKAVMVDGDLQTMSLVEVQPLSSLKFQLKLIAVKPGKQKISITVFDTGKKKKTYESLLELEIYVYLEEAGLHGRSIPYLQQQYPSVLVQPPA